MLYKQAPTHQIPAEKDSSNANQLYDDRCDHCDRGSPWFSFYAPSQRLIGLRRRIFSSVLIDELVTDPSSSSFEEQFRKCALLVAVYAIPPFLVIAAVNVLDPDIWWHLRTGQWIVQHRAVPYSDSFSWTGMGKPWAAYSWLFEVLIYGLLTRFGLIGILIYTYALLLAITAALHALIRKFEHRLAQSVGLTALALVAMTRVCSPRPWLFTILFVCIELNILVSVRRSRNFKQLLWLLPLFALWANLHIQFFYGFCVLGAAAVEALLIGLFPKRLDANEENGPLPARWLTFIIVGCMLAIALNPYHFHIYSVLLDTIRLGGFYALISELQAIPFRALSDWLVLLLALAAAFAFGRERRMSPFWLLLLAGSAFASFRAIRDVWFVVIVAATIVARSQSNKPGRQYHVTMKQRLVVTAGTVLLLILTLNAYQISNAGLQKFIDQDYPSAAAAFVEEKQLTGPLYNHFNWGGYLVWRLPRLAVSMDGRGNVHDPETVRRAFDTWNGKPGWSSDQELLSSNLIIAERDIPLTQLLRLDSRWKIVYEDAIAVVFVRAEVRY
jgi:hypothetical protein